MYQDDDLELTEEEKRLIREIENFNTYGTAGGAIGTGIGAIAGGLLASPTGVGIVPAAGLGASVGGTLGGYIGQLIGAGGAEKAQEKLQNLQQKRQEDLLERQARIEAYKQTLGRWSNWLA